MVRLETQMERSRWRSATPSTKLASTPSPLLIPYIVGSIFKYSWVKISETSFCDKMIKCTLIHNFLNRTNSWHLQKRRRRSVCYCQLRWTQEHCNDNQLRETCQTELPPTCLTSLWHQLPTPVGVLWQRRGAPRGRRLLWQGPGNISSGLHPH